MVNIYNDAVTDVIRKKIPEGKTVAQWLSENLKIEKESAYRRLRGEVLFTFDEIAKVAKALEFSIDDIVNIKNNNYALFSLNMLGQYSDTDINKNIDIYYNILEQEAKITQDIVLLNGKVSMTIHTIPHFFAARKEMLSKFRLYKWLYQSEKISRNFAFSEFTIPEKILKICKLYSDSVANISYIMLILDQNIFRSEIQDITYFYNRKIINKTEFELLREELFETIDFIEELALMGKNGNEKKRDIYISHINLEGSYVHTEYSVGDNRTFFLHPIGSLNSQNARICAIQRNWIESLKKFSILITQSAEMQRFKYLDIQRELIRNMGLDNDNLL